MGSFKWAYVDASTENAHLARKKRYINNMPIPELCLNGIYIEFPTWYIHGNLPDKYTIAYPP